MQQIGDSILGSLSGSGAGLSEHDAAVQVAQIIALVGAHLFASRYPRGDAVPVGDNPESACLKRTSTFLTKHACDVQTYWHHAASVGAFV